MQTRVAAVVVGISFAFAGTARSGNLTLHPSGFGKKSQAAWKAGEGRPDDCGTGSFALFFRKDVPTATFAAGVAVVNGIEGTAVSDLTGLSWEHRIDGHCGAGAPRWNVDVKGASGAAYTLFLGCAAATKTATSDPNWIEDSYAGASIVSVGGSNAGLSASQQADAAAGTVTGLSIVFDEGTDAGPGFVFLDNVTVEIAGSPNVWTASCDNANK